MDTFLNSLSEKDKFVIAKMRALILNIDTAVSETTGTIMRNEGCFIYKEADVFKYGLAKTKKYFSFHSMVLYTNTELRNFLTENGKSLKIQKGCINFTELAHFPLALFKEHLLLSKKADFSSVINHYKNKK